MLKPSMVRCPFVIYQYLRLSVSMVRAQACKLCCSAERALTSPALNEMCLIVGCCRPRRENQS